MLARILACIAATLVTLFSDAHACLAAPGDVAATIAVDGQTRTYLIHAPAARAAERMPLVFAFHGHFGSGARMAALTHLDRLADAERFIVVYPDGLGGGWNDGRPQDAGADDVAFVRALIARLEASEPIDPKRIYATGFSNGGTFVDYLGCRLADEIAAIAPVSGYLARDAVAGCAPARPLSALIIGGTADPIEPYEGAHVTIGPIDRGFVISAEATASFFKSNARCGDSPVVDALPPIASGDPTRVTRKTYGGCADGTNVVLETIVVGGHAWPGGPQYLSPFAIGLATKQLDASAAIVDFFLAHPRR